MPALILYSPEETWEHFQENKDELKKSMIMIANNIEYGVEIYITEKNNLPNFVVTADNIQVFEEGAVNEADCIRTANKIYDLYLTTRAISSLDSSFDYENEELISNRESELDIAVYSFISEVLGGCPINDNIFDEIVDDVKDHFIEYLARKFELDPYRPMVIEYDDGSESFEEYPYKYLEFDDDNPIYH